MQTSAIKADKVGRMIGLLNHDAELRHFIAETFLFGEEKPISIDESLRKAGILDSTGVLELITHLEEKYPLKVEDDELMPENLDTIERICAFIDKKIG